MSCWSNTYLLCPQFQVCGIKLRAWILWAINKTDGLWSESHSEAPLHHFGSSLAQHGFLSQLNGVKMIPKSKLNSSVSSLGMELKLWRVRRIPELAGDQNMLLFQSLITFTPFYFHSSINRKLCRVLAVSNEFQDLKKGLLVARLTNVPSYKPVVASVAQIILQSEYTD